MAKFDINESTGQILTKEPLDHETAPDCEPTDDEISNCYKVKVQVWDGLDEDRTEQDTSTMLTIASSTTRSR